MPNSLPTQAGDAPIFSVATPLPSPDARGGIETPTVTTSESRDQWAVLAGVRFVLALIVVMHHVSAQVPKTDLLHRADFGGLASVLGFFVISGYSMANSLTHDGSTKRFFERRFWRIYPSYLFALALAAVPSILFGTVFVGANPGFANSPDLHQFLYACFFMQGFITPGAVTANGVLWSLSIEIWLYAFCPLLFKAPLKWLQALAIVSLAVFLLFINPTLVFTYANGLAFAGMAWAFLAGFAYYRFPDRFGGILPMLLLAVFIGCWEGERFGPINFALVVAAVTMARNVKLDAAWRKWLIFAGNLSYPLYLVHVPVINMAIGFDYRHGIPIVAAAVVLAFLVRVLIETPIEWYRKRRKPVVPAAA